MLSVKRATAIVLCIALCISFIVGMKILSVTASAESNSNVTLRLNSIVNGQYGNGKYFPYNGNAVPASLAGVAGGRQCFGFARYVFYQLFGIPAPMLIERESDELDLDSTDGHGVTMREVASCKYSALPNGNTGSISKDAFAKAKPGDIVQCRRRSGSAHTMVVYSVTDTSLWILDCNVMVNKPNVVLLREESFNDFAYYNVNFTIYRAINYDPLTPPYQHYDNPWATYYAGERISVKWNMSSDYSAIKEYQYFLIDDSSGKTILEGKTGKVPSCSFVVNQAGTFSLYVYVTDFADNFMLTESKVRVYPKEFASLLRVQRSLIR